MKTPDKQQLKIEILAEKLLNQTITPEEFTQLEEWYNKPAEVTPVWELEDESKAELEQRLFSSINVQMDRPQKQFKLWKKLAIAATLLLVSGMGFLVWQSINGVPDIVQTVMTSTEGKISKVYLPDHSIVWLKGNSRLDFPSSFTGSTRDVTLHGEALFEVAKDRNHPFIIRTGKYEARVLGTSFNIDENANEQTFKLTVLTGKVSISPLAGNSVQNEKAVVVTPGKEFEVASAASSPRIVISPQSKKALILHGTEYDMNFQNSTFEELKTRIEKKFSIKINAEKYIYDNCSLSADVTDQSLENTMKVVSSVLNLNSYVINKNEITITGGGCN